MFIEFFTRALPLFISWARWIQFTPFHYLSLSSGLLLPSHLRLVIPSVLFPSNSLTKTLYASVFPRIYVYKPFPLLIAFSLIYSPNRNWRLSLCKFSSDYLLLLRPKYPAWHPTLQHPQAKPLSMWQTRFQILAKQQRKLQFCIQRYLG